MNLVQTVPECAEEQGGEARSEADVTHYSELSNDSGSRLWRLSLMGSLGGKLPGDEISAPPGLFLDTESQAVLAKFDVGPEGRIGFARRLAVLGPSKRSKSQ